MKIAVKTALVTSPQIGNTKKKILNKINMDHFIIKSLINRISKYKLFLSDKFFVASVIMGILFLIGSLFVNYSAIKYVNKEAGNSTTDILLDNLPVVNTNIVFSGGVLLFIVFMIIIFLLEPKTIPFTLKSVALFICIRSLFVTMTHLAPSPDRIVTDLDQFRYFSSGADLFFSGHTGMPFLMALLFWKNKYLRWIFIFSSLIAAAAVILGHLHYTIDVFSAFFITYGIYHIARKIFQKDHKLFTNGLKTNDLI
ncbi:MAG: hypothetical protein GWO87_03540 [Xanthomonadaceae bacterium]|nr:hypothetical protein [Rhodospirillaceae bacterium]NIA18234.1 hypothetical protein [Xanthomonadaceae bacterium]